MSKLSNHDKLRLLLNGSPLPSGTVNQQFKIHRVSWWTQQQCWAFHKEQSVWDVKAPGHCLFDELGVKRDHLGIIAVDARGAFTLPSLEKLFGKLVPVYREDESGDRYVAELRSPKGDTIARYGRDGFYLYLVGMNAEYRSKIAEAAVKHAARKMDKDLYAFPAHPSWITRSDKGAALNVLVTTSGDQFASLCRTMGIETGVDVLRIRAGKDGWSEYLSDVETLRIMVFPESDSEIAGDAELLDADGVFFVKKSASLKAGEWGLVRGTTTVPGGTAVVKARMVCSAAQASVGPNGTVIPDEYDGWAYGSAIKWQAPVSCTSVCDFKVAVVKYENVEEKDAYAVNLFYEVLGNWTPESTEWLSTVLAKNAKKYVGKLNDLDSHIAAAYERGLASDQDIVISDSYLTKYVLGLNSTAEAGVARSLNKLAKGIMTAHVRGSVYAGIAHRTHVMTDHGIVRVMPGEYIPTKAMRKAMQLRIGTSAKDTGVRYPNTTPGSFLSLSMSPHTLSDVNGHFCIVDPAAQKFWQSDGDDFALFLAGIESTATVESATVSVEKHVRPASGKLDMWTAYCHGRYCQDQTALLVAAYVSLMADIREFAPKKFDQALKLSSGIAQSIQDSVQGIKKYNDITLSANRVYELCESIRERLTDGASGSPALHILRGKLNRNIVAAVRERYELDLVIPSDRPVPEYDLDLTKDEKAIMNRLWEIESPASFHHALVDELLVNTIGTTREKLHASTENQIERLSAKKIDRAMALYTLFACRLADRGGWLNTAKLRGLSGLAIYHVLRGGK